MACEVSSAIQQAVRFSSHKDEQARIERERDGKSRDKSRHFLKVQGHKNIKLRIASGRNMTRCDQLNHDLYDYVL